MSGIEDVSYSLEGTIAAVRDYYAFLTKMFLNTSSIITPPSEGWPDIGKLECMGKTQEVFELLRHLSYIRRDEDDGPEGAPGCHFADWHEVSKTATDDDGRSLRECSEPPELVDHIPPHVIGLTYGGRNNATFLLDTKRGIVHWYECPDEMKNDKGDPNWVTPVTDLDDPFDWAPEDEAEWRAEHPAWTVEDFFKLLKRQFLELNFVPINTGTIYDVFDQDNSEESDMIFKVQDIYREHGWPNLDSFRKDDCLRAVRTLLREEYPDFVEDLSEDDDDDDEE